MSKQEFLAQLRKGLSGLPQDDTEERLTFYSEMIADRMEEGLSEEDAVNEIGSVDTIISQTVADIPLTKLMKEKAPQRRLSVWEIVLLVLGSPIWISLLIAAFAVILSIYVAWWSVIISFWAVFGSFFGCAFGSIIAAIVFAVADKGVTSVVMASAGLVCAGLSIFLFYGFKGATNGTLSLTKKIFLGIKRSFLKKEEA